jgi:hypothetical protein
MHALTEMVRHLRNGTGKNGLVLANGGNLTYQHVVCLSKNPPQQHKSYPERNPLPEYITDIPTPPIESNPEGPAVIEVSCGRLHYFIDHLAHNFARRIQSNSTEMEHLSEVILSAG